MREEQELTQNTINSFNRINEIPSLLKSVTRSNNKNFTIDNF